MAQVYNQALKKAITTNRIIDKIQGAESGPTVVFFAGIHGNETAGVFALEEALKKIKSQKTLIKGVVYGICGNLNALEQNLRYIDEDLNRLWTHSKLEALKKTKKPNSEEQEQIEVLDLLEDILDSDSAPYYFIDFHTTSSKTLPFITINDATINRKFSQQFPVPIVLGIEEYLEGPLLSYINGLGYVSLGFESGQHKEKEAIINCKAFIYLALSIAGSFNNNSPLYHQYYQQLKNSSKNNNEVFEVIDLFKIENSDQFKMKPEFKSFQNIQKGIPLATNNGVEISSKHNAKMFMPLYQEKGKEGFFIIKKIRPIYLKISLIIRNLKMDSLLVLLPGISWENDNKTTLLVNLKTAKFLAKPIFHLLGYRNRQINETHIRLNNRERAAKRNMYENQPWFNPKRKQ